MKKAGIALLTICCFILVFVLSGWACQGSSSELRASITKENTKKAQVWFSENMKNATLDEVAPEEGPYLISSDIVSGTYETEDGTHNFYLNVDTGECITTEMKSYFDNALSKRIADILNIDESKVSASSNGQELQGHQVYDEKYGSDDKSLNYNDYTVSGSGFFKANASKEDIDKFIDETLTPDVSMYIYITMENDEEVLNTFTDLSFVKAYPNIITEIYVKNTDINTTSYLLYCDTEGTKGKYEYLLTRYYNGADNNIESEVILSETP